MKELGIIRKIDELGRIVIPKEMRNSLNINNGDDIEIKVVENQICLKKHSILCDKVDMLNKYIDNLKEFLEGKLYITDKEKIITNGDLLNLPFNQKLRNILNERINYLSQGEETIEFGNFSQKGYYFILPIIKNSDNYGLIIIFNEKEMNEKNIVIGKVLQKLIENDDML